MFDADGKKSGEVTYELERLSGNKFIFSVIADENWINAEGRAFPVTIDPVIEVDDIKSYLLSKSAYDREVALTILPDMRYVGKSSRHVSPFLKEAMARTYFRLFCPGI